MSKLILSRVIDDKNKHGEKYKFAIPDLVKLMKTHITVNDEIFLPINVRKDECCFWESGGRSDQFISSVGTVISSDSDGILDAILFNKLNREPNAKQALVGLKRGYHLYVGKITIRHNQIVPKLKVLRLIFVSVDEELGKNEDYKVTYGKFVVDEIFGSCSDTEGCIPCERLIEKLFTKNVTRPYFINGWSASDISNISDKAKLSDAYMRLLSDDTPVKKIGTGNEFADKVEQFITSLNNKRLSAAFQWIDFNSNTMGIKPLSNMVLANISNTIMEATVMDNFTIELEDMTKCYNLKLLFDSDDLTALKIALKHDDTFSIEISENVFCILRGFRG